MNTNTLDQQLLCKMVEDGERTRKMVPTLQKKLNDAVKVQRLCFFFVGLLFVMDVGLSIMLNQNALAEGSPLGDEPLSSIVMRWFTAGFSFTCFALAFHYFENLLLIQSKYTRLKRGLLLLASFIFFVGTFIAVTALVRDSSLGRALISWFLGETSFGLDGSAQGGWLLRLVPCLATVLIVGVALGGTTFYHYARKHGRIASHLQEELTENEVFFKKYQRWEALTGGIIVELQQKIADFSNIDYRKNKAFQTLSNAYSDWLSLIKNLRPQLPERSNGIQTRSDIETSVAHRREVEEAIASVQFMSDRAKIQEIINSVVQ